MSKYQIYITPSTYQEIKKLPGNIKGKIKKAINNLAENPQLFKSKKLNLSNDKHEIWRLRLENWRILYAIKEKDKIIYILAIRKRPPYDYQDLEKILNDLM